MRPVSIHKNVLDETKLEDIVRLINNDIHSRGLSPKEMREWEKVNNPFPHLRFMDLIQSLPNEILNVLEIEPYAAGVLCEPQVIFHWPDPTDKPLNQFPHLDKIPDWANGRPYSRIVGVPLTNWTYNNGCPLYWHPAQFMELGSYSENTAKYIHMFPGDFYVMRPDVLHTAGVNTSGNIRMGIYYRWLQVLDASLA